MSLPARALSGTNSTSELVITAVAFAQFVHNDKSCAEPKHICVYSPYDFAYEADPILKSGCYVGEKRTDFILGSHHYYQFWVDELCRVIYKLPAYEVRKAAARYHDMSFIELILLPDNGVVVGHMTSRELSYDFGSEPVKTYDGALMPRMFWNTYHLLAEAFKLAQHAGFVLFP